MVNHWISQNYPKLCQSAKNISKNKEWFDLLHYALEVFLTHPKAEQLVQDGSATFFIVRILINSHRSTSSAYHTIYREGNRNQSLDRDYAEDEEQDIEDIIEEELLLQKIEHLIEDGLECKDPALWFRIKLLTLYAETPNYSELSRKIGISRTSISQAVKEAKEYILSQL